MSAESSLVVIKPDAIQRGLTGLILSRLDEPGITMIGAKVMRVGRELAEAHYNALRPKAFFEEVIQHICGKLHSVEHVFAAVYHGPGAIARIRHLAGATNPEKAEPRSIRGSYGRNTASGLMENVIHASSDPADAEREIKLWFRPDELVASIYPTKRKPGELAVWA
jgi:nucleoside-diphosphate kinase